MTDYLEQAAGGEADALWQASRETGVPRDREQSSPAGEEAESVGRAALPLLEETLRTERAQGSLPRLSLRRKGEGEIDLPARRRVQTGWTEGGPPDGRGWSVFSPAHADAGEGRLWAERVDQAFRRDSRRYDGPFSLY